MIDRWQIICLLFPRALFDFLLYFPVSDLVLIRKFVCLVLFSGVKYVDNKLVPKRARQRWNPVKVYWKNCKLACRRELRKHIVGPTTILLLIYGFKHKHSLVTQRFFGRLFYLLVHSFIMR